MESKMFFFMPILQRSWLTERQRMSKGCHSSPPKRKVFRFHENILRFGDWIPTKSYKDAQEGSIFCQVKFQRECYGGTQTKVFSRLIEVIVIII